MSSIDPHSIENLAQFLLEDIQGGNNIPPPAITDVSACKDNSLDQFIESLPISSQVDSAVLKKHIENANKNDNFLTYEELANYNKSLSTPIDVPSLAKMAYLFCEVLPTALQSNSSLSKDSVNDLNTTLNMATRYGLNSFMGLPLQQFPYKPRSWGVLDNSMNEPLLLRNVSSNIDQLPPISKKTVLDIVQSKNSFPAVAPKWTSRMIKMMEGGLFSPAYTLSADVEKSFAMAHNPKAEGADATREGLEALIASGQYTTTELQFLYRDYDEWRNTEFFRKAYFLGENVVFLAEAAIAKIAYNKFTGGSTEKTLRAQYKTSLCSDKSDDAFNASLKKYEEEYLPSYYTKRLSIPKTMGGWVAGLLRQAFLLGAFHSKNSMMEAAGRDDTVFHVFHPTDLGLLFALYPLEDRMFEAMHFEQFLYDDEFGCARDAAPYPEFIYNEKSATIAQMSTAMANIGHTVLDTTSAVGAWVLDNPGTTIVGVGLACLALGLLADNITGFGAADDPVALAAGTGAAGSLAPLLAILRTAGASLSTNLYAGGLVLGGI